MTHFGHWPLVAAGIHKNRLWLGWHMAAGCGSAAVRESTADRGTRRGCDSMGSVDGCFKRALARTRLERAIIWRSSTAGPREDPIASVNSPLNSNGARLTPSSPMAALLLP